MKILFVGDLVGRPGREILKRVLPGLQQEHGIEFTIVNVENAAAGFGVTPRLAERILSCGVDVMTSGNHIWDRKEVLDYFPDQPRLLRPGNYPPGTPGNFRYVGVTPGGVPVGVMNLQGRVFMPTIDCPFRMAEREIPRLAEKAAVTVVDFHAEATSEKLAFGWFVDGKVSAVLGTHTHVTTADERVLPQGTAYISDVGMTGASRSVIGMEVETSLARLVKGMSIRLEPATKDLCLSAVILDVDDDSGRARSIQRLTVKEPTDN